MEGRYPHVITDPAYQFGNPLFHFFRSFIGKSNGQNTERIYIFLIYKIGYAVGQYPCLTASCSGNDQKRTLGIPYSFNLLGVEIFFNFQN